MRYETAFPCPACAATDGYPTTGMPLRDWFAGQALAGDMAAQNESTGAWTNDVDIGTLVRRAKLMYRFADAMIQARDCEASNG